MMRESYMEVLPAMDHCFSSSSWHPGQAPRRPGAPKGGGGRWTREENKLFEDALARYEHGIPNRWERVAEAIPGKTVDDVVSHYEELELDVQQIEAGLVPCPGYQSSSSFTLDWEGGGAAGADDWRSSYFAGGKKPGGRGGDERKKGVLWTEEEHKLFLLGLKKYGKGDWRNISRNFVLTRTPTQVASHAQKYFLRLNSGCKDRKRSSIHDITTVNLADCTTPSPSNSSALTAQSATPAAPAAMGNQFSLTVDMKPNLGDYGMGFLNQSQDQSMLFQT